MRFPWRGEEPFREMSATAGWVAWRSIEIRPNLSAESNLPCYLGLTPSFSAVKPVATKAPSFCTARTNTVAPGFKRLLSRRTRVTVGVSGATSTTCSPFLVLEHYGPARAAADSASRNFLVDGKYTPGGWPPAETIHNQGMRSMR